MPYIPKKRQDEMWNYDGGYDPEDEGDLAFTLVEHFKDWLDMQGKWRFKHFARLFGTVILALLEFWWRVVRPYEDKKKEENGDVF